MKIFRRTLESGSHYKKLSKSKRFASIKRGNNRLVQGQVNIGEGTEKKKTSPNFFSPVSSRCMWPCAVLE